MKKCFIFLFLFALSKNLLCDYQYPAKEYSNDFVSAELDQYFKEKYKIFEGFIKGTCDYALTTGEHSFYIHPGQYVHNMDIALMPTTSMIVVGLLEIVNPVTVLIGVVVPLSAYAFDCYLKIRKDKNVVLQEALQNLSVVQQTRSYYELKRNELYALYQNLVQVKNGLTILLHANKTRATLSFALMNAFQAKPYNLSLLSNLSVEMNYSAADKQKLLKIREQELQNLEAQIIDVEMLLAFHMNELIERRDAAYIDLQEHMKIVHQYVALWDQSLHCLPYDLVLKSYRAAFVQEALSVDLENKINEINFVGPYYGKLKNQILQKSSNLYEVLEKQVSVNTSYLKYLTSLKDNFYKWVELDEQYLRNAGTLTNQLIKCLRNEANQKVFDKEKTVVVQAKKKKESMKDEQKKLEQKNDHGSDGGGGPEKDPDDKDPLPENNRSMMIHIFCKKEGHLLDTLANRKLLRELVKDVKNYIGKDITHQREWYAKITKEGKQLWAWMRGGVIRDGGLNNSPLSWNAETGFCSPIIPKR